MIVGRRYRLHVIGETNDVTIGVYDGFTGASFLFDMYQSFDITHEFTCQASSVEPKSLQFDLPTVSPRGILTMNFISLQEI